MKTQIELPKRPFSRWHKPADGWIKGELDGEAWITDGHFAIKSDKIPTGHTYRSTERVGNLSNLFPPVTRPVYPVEITTTTGDRPIEVIVFNSGHDDQRTLVSAYFVAVVNGQYPGCRWEQVTPNQSYKNDVRTNPVVAVVDGKPVAIIMPIRP